MTQQLRRTGIPGAGEITWGSHLCLFHQTKEDLLSVLAKFFTAGLTEGDFCVWVLAPPLTQEETERALRQAVPDLDRYLARESIAFVDHEARYAPSAPFDLPRVVAGWQQYLDHAIETGHAGLRATGSSAWLHTRDRRRFHAYEDAISRSIVDRQMILLCTFPLDTSGAHVLDVARAHQAIIALRSGRWDMIETRALMPSTLATSLRAPEIAVLRLLLEGRTNPEIARRLHYSVGTVKDYVQELLYKLGVSNRTQAAVKAVRERILG